MCHTLSRIRTIPENDEFHTITIEIMKRNIAFAIFCAASVFLTSCNREDSLVPDFRVRAYVTEEVYWDAAVLRGEIAFNENAEISGCGFLCSADRNEVLDRSAVRTMCDGEDFVTTISGLEPETVYYAAAYADCGNGVQYSSIVNFKTTKNGSLTIVSASVPVQGAIKDKAVLKARIVEDNGVRISEMGVEYWPSASGEEAAEEVRIEVSPSEAPESGDEFSIELTGLAESVPYSARLWAYNGRERSYTDLINFATAEYTIAELVTIRCPYSEYENIVDGTSDPFIGSGHIYMTGEITSFGGTESLQECGFEWGLSPDNLDNKSKVDPPASAGRFYAKAEPGEGAIIWYRAYAVNEAGTAYGTIRSAATPVMKEQWKKDADGVTTVPNSGVMLNYMELDPIEAGSTRYIFLDRNLGATEPVSDINASLTGGSTSFAGIFGSTGDYYIFGNPVPALTIDAESASFDPVSSVDRSIVLDPSNIEDGNWTLNQPCPDGYRLPSSDDWNAIISKYSGISNKEEKYTAIKTALNAAGTSFLRLTKGKYQIPTNYNQYSTYLWSSDMKDEAEAIGSYFIIEYSELGNIGEGDLGMDRFGNANVAGTGIPVRCMRTETIE